METILNKYHKSLDEFVAEAYAINQERKIVTVINPNLIRASRDSIIKALAERSRILFLSSKKQLELLNITLTEDSIETSVRNLNEYQLVTLLKYVVKKEAEQYSIPEKYNHTPYKNLIHMSINAVKKSFLNNSDLDSFITALHEITRPHNSYWKTKTTNTKTIHNGLLAALKDIQAINLAYCQQAIKNHLEKDSAFQAFLTEQQGKNNKYSKLIIQSVKQLEDRVARQITTTRNTNPEGVRIAETRDVTDEQYDAIKNLEKELDSASRSSEGIRGCLSKLNDYQTLNQQNQTFLNTQLDRLFNILENEEKSFLTNTEIGWQLDRIELIVRASYFDLLNIDYRLDHEPLSKELNTKAEAVLRTLNERELPEKQKAKKEAVEQKLETKLFDAQMAQALAASQQEFHKEKQNLTPTTNLPQPPELNNKTVIYQKIDKQIKESQGNSITSIFTPYLENPDNSLLIGLLATLKRNGLLLGGQEAMTKILDKIDHSHLNEAQEKHISKLEEELCNIGYQAATQQTEYKPEATANPRKNRAAAEEESTPPTESMLQKVTTKEIEKKETHL